MRKTTWFRNGMTVILGICMTAVFGTLTSFAYDSASLSTCTIDNGNSIVITGTATIDTRPMAERYNVIEQEPGPGQEGAEPEPVIVYEEADDGYYYLFELHPYEEEIGTRTNYLSWCNKSETLRLELPFDRDPANTMLYSRYVLAIKTGNTFRAISNSIYVTNPGDIAAYTASYPEAMSKKGLLIQLDMLNDAMNLGVKHTIVNIPYHQLFGEGIEYQYNGKTYSFNDALIAEYDRMISAFSGKGIIVSAILLNGWTDSYPQLREPGLAQNSNAFYYGFNVSTEEGYEATRAIFSFMAERYSGKYDEYGRVSNWIVGNEINNNKNWNYTGPMDLATYTKKFERVFRVAYTAIKSHNKNARVFFSTDYEWKKANTSTQYAARDFLDAFNDGIRSEGNIEWGLAYHPYPYPMVEPEFWDDDLTGAVLDSVDSPIVNLKNIHILTNYLEQPKFRTSGGEVRHVILSEQGFTSTSPTRGDIYDIQAAAFAYAYYLVDANPYIDAFIMSRQVDAIIEVEQSCAFGIWTVDMSRPDKVIAVMPKNIYNVFKYIDTRSSLKHTEFAKEIIGISRWSDVIPGFRLQE